VGGQVQLEHNFERLLRGLFTPLGAFFEAKGSIGFSYSGEETCCAKKREGMAMKVEGSGGGNLEGVVAIPLLPVLKRLSTFTFGEWLSGPSVTVKLGLSGSLFGDYESCGQVSNKMQGRISGAFELALSSLGSQGQVSFADGSKKNIEFRLLDIGVGGLAQVETKRWLDGGKAFEIEFKAQADGFIESQLSIGVLGWTILDIKAPIATSDPKQYRVDLP